MLNLLFISLMFISSTRAQESEGIRFMRLGCEKQKQALGCYNYANFQLKAGKNKTADRYFKKGCKLGYKLACDKMPWGRSIASVEEKSEAPIVEVKTETSDKDHFLTSLKSCSPDQITYNNPALKNTITEKIIGMQEGKCRVIISGSGDLVCLFDDKQLQDYIAISNGSKRPTGIADGCKIDVDSFK